MNEKLLFIYSGKIKIDLPNNIFEEYQVKTILCNSKLLKTIIEYKPQIILLDEFVPFSIIRSIYNKFKFIPIAIVGSFEKSSKAEKFLELGVSLINISQSEAEMISTIRNLLWFSLSKQDLWDQEYDISKYELRKEKILSVSKFFFKVIVVVILLVGVPKLYNFIFSFKKFFYELDIEYITASDISVLDGRYIINDWTIKNLFEYETATDNLVKIYSPQEQLNSLSVNSDYVIGFSMFTNKVYLYRYPDFSLIVAEELLKNTTVLSIYIDDRNHLYLLDNKRVLYEFIIKDNKFIFVSSNEIKEFFPIDVVVQKDKIYLLDNSNNLYVLNKDTYKKEKTIVLSMFFEPKQYKFSSFGISDKWLYLVSEKEKKIIKINNEFLKV